MPADRPEQVRHVVDDILRGQPIEIAAVCQAISRHRAKGEIDGDVDELLKDADVLQHTLFNPGFATSPQEKPRPEVVLAEIGVDIRQVMG